MSKRIPRRPDPELDAIVRRAKPGRCFGRGAAAEVACAKVLVKYDRMVQAIAAAAQRPTVHDDLAQAGRIGLLHAISDYDAAKGSNFTSWAYLWIRHAVQEELTQHTPVMRVSRGIGHNLVERVAGVARKLETKHGRPPTAAEVKKVIGNGPNSLSLTQIESALTRALPSAVPHDRLESVSVGGEDEMIDAVDGRQRDREVQAALAGLTSREQAVVRLRHVQDMTAKDAAAKLGISLEVLRNAEYSALAKLREALG